MSAPRERAAAPGPAGGRTARAGARATGRAGRTTPRTTTSTTTATAATATTAGAGTATATAAAAGAGTAAGTSAAARGVAGEATGRAEVDGGTAEAGVGARTGAGAGAAADRAAAAGAAAGDAAATATGAGGAPAAPWSAGDPYADALRVGRGPLYLRRTDGWLLPLEVERWCARADTADLEVLRRCEGAVLDVGCGPGRLIAALAAQGRRALGIDVSEAAVERTVGLGGQALHRSVFDSVPGEGRWGTALLIDGNLGIGGDPAALLDRMDQLLAPDGLLIVETVPVDVDERVRVRVADGRGAAGTPFPWARLGTPALLRHARRAGWRPDGQWSTGGRSFVALRSRSASSTAEPPNSTAVISSQRARKPVPARPVADR